MKVSTKYIKVMSQTHRQFTFGGISNNFLYHDIWKSLKTCWSNYNVSKWPFERFISIKGLLGPSRREWVFYVLNIFFLLFLRLENSVWYAGYGYSDFNSKCQQCQEDTGKIRLLEFTMTLLSVYRRDLMSSISTSYGVSSYSMECWPPTCSTFFSWTPCRNWRMIWIHNRACQDMRKA